ncbi:MAG: heavy-metal-associated domain-containing protein [Elainellaceae cyanobacterium]
MAMTFNVPSITCQGCADTITEVLKAADPEAKIDVDVDKKTVSIDSGMAESSARQAIVSVGHEVK